MRFSFLYYLAEDGARVLARENIQYHILFRFVHKIIISYKAGPTGPDEIFNFISQT